MELILYHAPLACSLVPFVTLVEAGADFKVCVIDLRRGEQLKPEFLNVNPFHAVPVLTVNGAPLLENLAIQMWVARTFPEARLLPEEPMAEYRALSLMAWCSSALHPRLWPIIRPRVYCDVPDCEDRVQRLGRSALLEVFAVAEHLIQGREWFFDHFTAVDAHFFWCVRRAKQLGVDLSQLKHCAAHFARMSGRSSVERANEFEAQVLLA